MTVVNRKKADNHVWSCSGTVVYPAKIGGRATIMESAHVIADSIQGAIAAMEKRWPGIVVYSAVHRGEALVPSQAPLDRPSKELEVHDETE